jgi:glyoxylase-like metal-dependent hydrolase (beta-lactamase superfamily II)
MDDLEERVFGALPDETWVYPGHGDDTTLGAERPKIPEWRARGWCASAVGPEPNGDRHTNSTPASR